MAEQKTITAREIQQIAATFEEKEKYIMWHGKRIKVTPLLSFADTFELLRSVSDGCLQSSSHTIIPEVVDFVFKSKTLEKYGNIVLPDNIDIQYQIIYSTDLVDIVWNAVNQSQLNMLKKLINSYSGIYLYE